MKRYLGIAAYLLLESSGIGCVGKYISRCANTSFFVYQQGIIMDGRENKRSRSSWKERQLLSIRQFNKDSNLNAGVHQGEQESNAGVHVQDEDQSANECGKRKKSKVENTNKNSMNGKQVKQQKAAKRTQSFQPLCHEEGMVDVHTLVLGTHPSIKSLEGNRYFDHPMNAFWWIAGDCLGFRRAPGKKANGDEYTFVKHLKFGPDQIIAYDEQVKIFLDHGFALWDIVASCERPGSLDSNIKKEIPNEIRKFCEERKTIKSKSSIEGDCT